MNVDDGLPGGSFRTRIQYYAIIENVKQTKQAPTTQCRDLGHDTFGLRWQGVNASFREATCYGAAKKGKNKTHLDSGPGRGFNARPLAVAMTVLHFEIWLWVS
jgi:hypothetical protein